MPSRSITPRLLAALGLTVLMAACSVSTAHIGSFKIGKDRSLATQTTKFSPHDTIYASGDADNVPDKVKLQWSLVAENVAGQPKNLTVSQFNKSFDLDSDATTTYNLSPPTAGWPTGTYKIVLTMMEDGKQRDQKTTEFTVSPT